MTMKRAPLMLCDDWDRLFPVQALFNAISDESLIGIIKHLTGRQGYSSDYCHCHFPSDLDPGEPTFEGVRFALYDDVVVITEERFPDCLDLLSESFGKAYPAKAHRMTALASAFRQSLGEAGQSKTDEAQ